jgi:hypothetical protein
LRHELHLVQDRLIYLRGCITDFYGINPCFHLRLYCSRKSYVPSRVIDHEDADYCGSFPHTRGAVCRAHDSLIATEILKLYGKIGAVLVDRRDPLRRGRPLRGCGVRPCGTREVAMPGKSDDDGQETLGFFRGYKEADFAMNCTSPWIGRSSCGDL